jgi:hypothetical protein
MEERVPKRLHHEHGIVRGKYREPDDPSRQSCPICRTLI